MSKQVGNYFWTKIKQMQNSIIIDYLVIVCLLIRDLLLYVIWAKINIEL
jgi:hypothetical protein